MQVRVFLAELVRVSAGEEVNSTWWMQRDIKSSETRRRAPDELLLPCCLQMNGKCCISITPSNSVCMQPSKPLLLSTSPTLLL